MKRYSLTAAVIAFLALFFFCAKENTLYSPSHENNYKVEVFAADTSGITGAVLRDSIQNILKAQLSTIPGKPITFFGFITGDMSKVTPKWDFGDDKSPIGTIVEYIYDTSGTFKAIFSITDNQGSSISDTIAIIVKKIFKSSIKGWAMYQGKTSHTGIQVAFRDKLLTNNPIPSYTRSDGLFQIDSGFPYGTYDVIYTDSLNKGAFDACTLKDISIKEGKLNIIPTVTLKDSRLPHIFNNSPSGVLASREPVISAGFLDTGSGIAQKSFVFVFNDDTIPDSLIMLTATGFSWKPRQRLCDGKHTIQTTISDSAGNPVKANWTFTVDAMKIVILTPDTAVRINDTVRIRSIVHDVYSKVAQYRWDFDGNGTWDDSAAQSDTLVSRSHVYTHDTVYRAIECVRNDSGMVKLDTVTITVGNLPPKILSIRSDTTISIKDSIQLFGSATDADGTIKEYAWDFNGDGIFEYTSATQVTAGYRYNAAGVYNAILRVTDDDNKKNYDTARIAVLQDVPVPNAGKDTTVSINDTVRLHGAAIQQFGAIVEWAWDIGNAGTFKVTSNSDTSIIAPAAENPNYLCVLKMTDDDGNVAKDTVKIVVRQDMPQIVFLTGDTVVDYGGAVRCSVYVLHQYGTMTIELDTANNGSYKNLGAIGLSGEKSGLISTAGACSWDSVKIRVTDDDGNVVTGGFRLKIRPRQLTITSVDSMVSTITVHYSRTAETDFAEYRIYRNTSNSVDTTSELWATIPTEGIVSYTTPSPSYTRTPRYYRVYQKDKEGLWSAGSNVVYGNIVNSPPLTPIITYPSNNGDSIWSNEVLRWKCSDPNHQVVTYKVLINYNNSGYVQYGAEILDTFVRLRGYDSLGIAFKVIAYDSDGDSSDWSAERTAIIHGNIVLDVEGNIYNVVKIGNQIWMAENLKTTKYNDGAAIPLVKESSEWVNRIGYCWYNNDSATYAQTYGALYNWYIVNTGKLAPIGWHVPSDSEWSVLTAYLGGEITAGGKLKEAGLDHWAPPNTGATNETGFSALPGGSRDNSGAFMNFGGAGQWWSFTASDATHSVSRTIDYTSGTVVTANDNNGSGFSVRCVRDQ